MPLMKVTVPPPSFLYRAADKEHSPRARQVLLGPPPSRPRTQPRPRVISYPLVTPYGEHFQPPQRKSTAVVPAVQPEHRILAPRNTTTIDKNHKKPTRLSKNPFSAPVYNSSESSLSSLAPSISEKFLFSLAVNPTEWDLRDHTNTQPEADDYLHNPDPRRDRLSDKGGHIFTPRGVANVGCIALLIVGCVTLLAGYPIMYSFLKRKQATLGGYNLGGINATGQIPTMTGGWSLIDKDTPKEAYTKASYTHGDKQMLELVFSDEFNLDGRSFYPGDDPYWEAVDLHYWGTRNLEWYDPEAITTKDGNLVITLSEKATHDLDYEGGLLSSWNKFCFTGGLLEVSVVMPGSSSIYGLWPAVWTLGNLGRVGYGATLEGLWPYSYDTCDVGTVKNQTINGVPAVNLKGNDRRHGGRLSYQLGQRLSACTCDGESHPGPKRPDGTYVGRGAPEIDIFEATVSKGSRTGLVSQSGQWAPFDYKYTWKNTTENFIIHDRKNTKYNDYVGGIFQQCTSGIVKTDQSCYELDGGCHSVYGFEYLPGNDGYITWISDGKATWTLMGAGMGPNPMNKIGYRPVPQEPMYIIANLGMSYSFGDIAFKELVFPVHMLIDYVRVYQPKDQINIGCDPKDFPTKDYIERYPEAYSNPNITTWAQYKQPMPRNRLIDNCT